MPNVLHIDTEDGWRGGQNQVSLLIEGMRRGFAAGEHQFRPFAALLHNGALERRLSEDGFADSVGLPKPWFRPDGLLKLKRFVDTHRIELIDAHSSQAHNIGLVLRRVCPQVKLAVHRRVDYRPSQTAWGGWKYRSGLVNGFITISEAIGRILIEHGLPREKLFVVRSAIDVGFYSQRSREQDAAALRQRYRIDAGDVIIVSAGAFTQQKRFDCLLRSLQKLKMRRHRGWRAIILGDGPLREELTALRDELQLQHHLLMPGFVNDVREQLNGADLFALASEFEGLGTILLEASAAGLPVVATGVGGIPEIVRHGETGRLVAFGDWGQFAAGLDLLIGESELRHSFGHQASRWARSSCSVENMVNGNLQAYERILMMA